MRAGKRCCLEALNGPIRLSTIQSNDNRGFFEKPYGTWLTEAIAPTRFGVAEVGRSGNTKAGTIRGLHFQSPPFTEAKLVHCIRGRIWDVAVDIRTGSPSFGCWAATELTADRPEVLFVPKGFAHGFQTLEDDTEIFYLLDSPYAPDHVAGLNPFDPTISIAWPLPMTSISDRDAKLPDFSSIEPLSSEGTRT